MAHFLATSPLFEEIETFQEADFEQFWNQANDSIELSDEEKNLFPGNLTPIQESQDEIMNSNHILFNFDHCADSLSNPMMTSVALQDIQPNSSQFDEILESEDMAMGESLYDMNTEIINSDDLQFIVEDSTVSDLPKNDSETERIRHKSQAEDIFEIHSYSQQPQQPQEPSIKTETIIVQAAPTKSTAPVYKSKGKVGPPAPKVQTPKKTQVLKTVQSGRVAKRQRKPVRHFDESSEEENDSDYTPEMSSNKIKKTRENSTSSNSNTISNNSSNRKAKLYEQGPFSDPDMERCRQNAVNAKINRDRKRNEKNSMQKEMSKLRRENQDLKKKNMKYRQRLTSFESRLAVLESLIRSQPRLDEMLKASGNADFVSKGFNDISQFDENFSVSSSGEDVVNDPSDVIYYSN